MKALRKQRLVIAQFQIPGYRWCLFACISSLLATSIVAAQSDTNDVVAAKQWAQWRGPVGTGASDTATPPVRWGEDENLAWKIEIPGLGHSSPIVWEDTVLVTSAVPVGDPFDPIPDSAPGSHDNLSVSQAFKFIALAVHRKTGKVLWETELHRAVPHEGGHVSASLASASPVTDGVHWYVYFGTYGLYCLDFEGKLVWKKSLGKMNTKHGHGEGASPTLHGGTLVVNWDHEGQSWLFALDKKTGEERWKKPREEVTSWASPIVEVVDGKPQVIVAGTAAVRGYDLETGEVIWSCGGLSHNICATPIASDGLLYVASSYEIRSLIAIRLSGAKGDVTDSDHVVWKRNDRTPYVPSPLLYRGRLYWLRHYQGILSIADAKTGEETTGPFRINGLRNLYASPAAADGKIFLTDREGVTVVLSEPEFPRVLSVNRLDDTFSASMALAGNQLWLRGEKYLYCFSDSNR